MNETRRLARSPQLMSRDDSALLVVDVQEKLIPLIPGHERLVWNIRRLIDGAAVLGVAVAGTEQYPRGLGHTIAELRDRLGDLPEKLLFSCGGCPELFERWRDAGIYKILLCGIESHVCVQQTAFDLLGEGFQVYLAVDAVGARFSIDHQTALRRMETAGASLTTTESALFEWCEAAGTTEFKQISALVREPGPA
ncbi:MAG: hydrolase [Planctomycetales bacterium]|nr:hydrolase [Planctomycetales bacterium]